MSDLKGLYIATRPAEYNGPYPFTVIRLFEDASLLEDTPNLQP